MSDTERDQPTLAELAHIVATQQRQIAVLTARPTAPGAQGSGGPMRRKRFRMSSVLGLCLALLFGTVALAAIPGAGGVISGCYDKSTGKLRVIDAQAGKKCDKGELPLTWNQTGLQGIAGPKGATGAQGSQGPAGAIGPIGPAGAIGPQGLIGPKGDKGDSTGVPGPKGDKGDPGPIGPQGVPGATGPAGATGPQGIPGEAGPKGDTGSAGPQGAVGPAGAAASADMKSSRTRPHLTHLPRSNLVSFARPASG